MAPQVFGGEGSGGESDSDVELEDPVLGLGGSGSGEDDSSEFSEEEGESDGASSSEEEEEEEEEGEGRGGRQGGKKARAVKDGDVVGSRARRREAGSLLKKMERQNKLMEMKLRAEAGEDDSGEEGEEEPAEGDERGWGRNRKAYYQKGDEQDREEEALEREEAEALRLQRQGAERLAASDFDMDLEEEEDEEGEGAGAVPADLVALSAEEREALAGQDAPELAALLGELQESMSEVRNVVQPLLKQVREGGLVTERGLSFLEAKHLLLLAYCGHIVHYLLIKAEGGTIQGHPVVAQLVQLRAYLEKVKPIDKKLQHQVERLLRASGADADAEAGAGGDGGTGAGGKGGRGDAMRHRPNPGALVAKAGAAPGGSDSEGSEGEEDGRAPGGGGGCIGRRKSLPLRSRVPTAASGMGAASRRRRGGGRGGASTCASWLRSSGGRPRRSPCSPLACGRGSRSGSENAGGSGRPRRRTSSGAWTSPSRRSSGPGRPSGQDLAGPRSWTTSGRTSQTLWAGKSAAGWGSCTGRAPSRVPRASAGAAQGTTTGRRGRVSGPAGRVSTATGRRGLLLRRMPRGVAGAAALSRSGAKRTTSTGGGGRPPRQRRRRRRASTLHRSPIRPWQRPRQPASATSRTRSRRIAA